MTESSPTGGGQPGRKLLGLSRQELLHLGRQLVPPLLGIVVILYLFYPGYLNNDSLWQLDQAQRGVFNDRHPPFMAWAWRQMLHLIPGPGGMLIVQTVLFWLGLAYILKVHTRTYRGYFIATLFVGFFPPILAHLSTVMNNEAVMAALVAAIAAFIAYRRKRSLIFLVAGTIFVFGGIALRHESILAALPIIWFGVWCVLERYAVQGWKPRVLGFLAATALLFGTSTTVNRALTDQQDHVWQVMPMYDITAISVLEGTLYHPAYMLRNYQGMTEQETLAILQRKYAEIDAWVLYADWLGPRLVYTQDPRLLRQAAAAWIGTVGNHLGTYVVHRLYVLAKLFGMTGHIGFPFATTIYPNKLGLTFEANWANAIVMKVLGRLSQSVFFMAWIYIVALIGVGLGSLVWRGGDYRLPLLLSASGLLYIAQFFVIIAGWHFRYNLWTVFCTVLALVVMWSLSYPHIAAAVQKMRSRLGRAPR